MQKRKIFLWGSFSFLFFVFFSYIVHKNFFTQFDFDTTVRLQDNISASLDYIFSVFSVIGDFEITLGILLLILLLIRKRRGIIAIFSFGLFHIIELFGKFYVDHLPPPEFMIRTQKIIEFPQFHVRSEFSFPSGHAGRTTFLVVLAGLTVWNSRKFSRTQKLVILSALVLFDITMMVSRVYLGEHWTSDVIGGALLGASLVLLSLVFI